MKKLILSELLLLFLATTFMTDSLPPGWYQQTLPLNDQITDIFFLDSLTGWVTTQGGNNDTSRIIKTTDGGLNWSIQNDSMFNIAVIQFVDNNTGYAAGGNGRAKFLKTTNSGSLWTVTTPFGSNISDVKDIFYINTDTGWFCSDDPFGGGIYKTTNGGINWTPQLAASFHIQKLFFFNKDTGWAGSADWKLYRTTNSGQVWELLYTFSGAPNVFFPTKDTGYTGLYKTTNGGFNWLPMNNGQGGSGIFFLNSVTGYSCAGFSVMQKTVDGLSWFNQTVPSGGWVSIRFSDTSKGWAGGSNLIHTTDGGGPPQSIHQISTEIPSNFKLYQNYPNPFNPETKIKYQITESSNVIMRVYDIQGKEVVTLVDQKQSAGTYEADFDGSRFSSGIYFYRIYVETDDPSSNTGKIFNETGRMILLK